MRKYAGNISKGVANVRVLGRRDGIPPYLSGYVTNLSVFCYPQSLQGGFVLSAGPPPATE